MRGKVHFFSKKFAHIKKKQYYAHSNFVESEKMVNHRVGESNHILRPLFFLL